MNENNILDIEQSVPDDNVISESSEGVAEDSQITEQDAADPVAEQSEADGSASSGEVIIDIPEYSVENPLPVMLVEPEVEEIEEVEVFALTGKYYGTISDTYLDYFEGIVQKLSPAEHYVVWRSGQYAYTMAYGEEIVLDGCNFSGACKSVSLYRSDSYASNEWYCSFSDDLLSLSATDLFVYSDLGEYPMLERGATYGMDMALLSAVCVAMVFVLVHSIFDYIVKYIYRGVRTK